MYVGYMQITDILYKGLEHLKITVATGWGQGGTSVTNPLFILRDNCIFTNSAHVYLTPWEDVWRRCKDSVQGP
jgi:hypothetical protein